MVVLKVSSIGYIRNDNHTVKYYRSVKEFLGENFVWNPTAGNIEHVIAPTFQEGLEILQQSVAKYISDIWWLKADLNDFYFTEAHSEVKDGKFWLPSGTYCHNYRVSDLKKV